MSKYVQNKCIKLSALRALCWRSMFGFSWLGITIRTSDAVLVLYMQCKWQEEENFKGIVEESFNRLQDLHLALNSMKCIESSD